MDGKAIAQDVFSSWLRRREGGAWMLRFAEAPTFKPGLNLCLRPNHRDESTCDLIVEVVENSFAPDVGPGASGFVGTIPRAMGRAIYDKVLGVRLSPPRCREMGCDGTTYTLTVNDSAPTLRFVWWGELPAEWIDLQPVVDDLLALTRAQQPPLSTRPTGTEVRMSRYAQLTPRLIASDAPTVMLTFDELDAIVAGGLPESAKKYSAWWTNRASSQPHARFWLDAGRMAFPDFKERQVAFTLDSSVDTKELAASVVGVSTPQDLTEFVESSLSLERDLEDQIVSHLELLEPGLTLLSRQETSEVGRIDLLARDSNGGTVIIELKAGEARDSTIGQIARYIGWYGQKEGRAPRAIVVASGFPAPVRYAAKAIPGLRLVTYRVQFAFDDASL